MSDRGINDRLRKKVGFRFSLLRMLFKSRRRRVLPEQRENARNTRNLQFRHRPTLMGPDFSPAEAGWRPYVTRLAESAISTNT